jgi:rare lipoprotein A
MIARAKMVFPGVVVSMMLAAHAHASHAGTQAQTRKSVSSQAATRHGGRTLAVASRSRRYRHVDASATAYINDAVAWSLPERADADGEHRSAQTGLASWYGGSRWHGHMTSSGERYDQEALTAAHATLPLGTLVRVSMVDGSGAVVVRITDRPGTRRRIIDLSQAAARELGMLSRGVAMVRLEPL